MLDLIFTILFAWLFFKVLGLVFKVAWSLTKLFAIILFVLAIPALVVCFIFAGGLLLLIPVCIVGVAYAMLSAI